MSDTDLKSSSGLWHSALPEIVQVGPAEIDVGGPIAVETRPCATLPCAAAFYDEECDKLFVHIMPFEPYHSFLESDGVRIDTDAVGRPIFIEVSMPQTEWEVVPSLLWLESDRPAALVFRQTRRRFCGGQVIVNMAGDVVRVKLLARDAGRIVQLADHLAAEVADGFLAGFWLRNVQRDFAERRQGLWRRTTAARLRAAGRRWRCCSRDGTARPA